jgi:hypothetical protein
MMEAASTSERSVNFYQTTLRNSPEDSSRLHQQETTLLKEEEGMEDHVNDERQKTSP